jgi:uncharacterized SAM-binding protein YcdF (DUF218 family)
MNFIIVLGSSKPEIRKARVEKAVDYYNHLSKQYDYNSNNFYNDFSRKSTEMVKLIFSGKGKSTSITEAEDMKLIAMGLGVKESECIIEKESQNTRENIINSLTLLQTYGNFKPTFYMTKPMFTICTSHFHAARSLIIAIEILSSYGYVNIIHTEEQIPIELAEREKAVLDHYIHKYLLPKSTVNYSL